LQETLGRVYEPFSRPNWLPGSLIASAVITGSWGLLIYTGSVDTIWPMFGVANQSLSILALTLVTTWLVNQGKAKWMWVTLVPLLWVCSTTLTAATLLVTERFPAMMKDKPVTATLSTVMTVFVVVSVLSLLTWSVARWVVVLRRK
jgi:carbon starvation protein